MIIDQFRLDGKVAIVTGCAAGLGQGIARGLAEAGAEIAGVDYVESAETQSMIQTLGRSFLAIRADLSTLTPIPALLQQVLEAFGKIDILVNNAGIVRRADAIEFSEADWDGVMNLNLKSLFFLSQAVAKRFIAQGTGGKIINIASMLSYQGGIRVPSYTASKSGVMGVTRAMANEWAKHGINVNAIAPGYMATNNTAPLRADAARSAEILGRIPANRWGTPADLQGVAVFLASQAADYVQGFTIAVDGGWLAR